MFESIDVPDWLIPVLTGVVVPLLVGLAIKLRAHPGWKALASIVISALASILETLAANNGHLDANPYLLNWAITTATAILAYLGLWQPVGGGVSDPVSLATPHTGFGAEVRSVPAKVA